jgi:hypothetical protein
VAASASAFSLPLLAGAADAGSSAATALPTPQFYRAHVDGRKLRAIVDHADACVLPPARHFNQPQAGYRGAALPATLGLPWPPVSLCAQVVLGCRPQFARRVARRPRRHEQQGARVRAACRDLLLVPLRIPPLCLYVTGLGPHPSPPPALVFAPQRAAAHGRRVGRGCALVARRLVAGLSAQPASARARARALCRSPHPHTIPDPSSDRHSFACSPPLPPCAICPRSLLARLALLTPPLRFNDEPSAPR